MKKLNDLIQDDINNIKSIDEIFKYQPLKKIDLKVGNDHILKPKPRLKRKHSHHILYKKLN